MHKRTTTRMERGLFVDRNIDRINDLLTRFKPFLSRRANLMKLTDFDAAAEQTLGEIFGEASDLLEAYEYAKVGEAAGLVNLPEEAQENGAQDIERESLQQRKRVAEYMSPEVRSIAATATIKDAGRLLQKLKVGSLLVDDDRRYIGIITDTDLSRKAVARGLDPNSTPVKACMSRPVLTIEDDEAMESAVKMMK